MAYYIEILSVGMDEYETIKEVTSILNSIQDEFIFKIPPERLKKNGYSYSLQQYKTSDVFEWLRNFRKTARGDRKYLIGVISGQLSSDNYKYLFGSHEAEEGLAIITLADIEKFVNFKTAFLAYYFVRYALSFVNPKLKSHEDTRSCYFDKKINKKDIKNSLLSNGNLCDNCTVDFQNYFNPEIAEAFKKMATAVTALENNDYETIKKLKPSRIKDRAKFILPWWVLSIISGLLGLLIYKILEHNPKWIDEAAIVILITIFVLLINPKRRFYKAFWTSMSLLSSITLIPAFNLTAEIDFQNLNKIEKVLFNIVTNDPHWSVHVILGIIAIVSLILDYLERGGSFNKLKAK